MERNRILGLVCGYYLSRFDALAYEHLGFETQNATHEALGTSLDIKPSTIKNWRDEFDPIHQNERKGWYQRPMNRSRVRTVDALSHLSELELFSIVSDFIRAPDGDSANELIQVIGDDTAVESDQREYGLRGPTGHAAEQHFERYHQQHGLPHAGTLVDCRHDQCGYDYRIETESEIYFVEVKGLATDSGGISFTNREWLTAQENGMRYFLVVVKNISEKPEFVTIQNPGVELNPTMRVYTTIQTSWSARIAR